MAYVDTTNFTIGWGEFLDNEQFTNTESFLVQVGAKECLYEKRKDNELEQKKLMKLLGLMDVAARDVKGAVSCLEEFYLVCLRSLCMCR